VGSAWDRLRDHFGGWKVPAITANALESYAAERLREAAPATAQYELAVLRRAMSLAVKKGQLRDRPHTSRTSACYMRPDNLAVIYVALGEYDAAFRWLTLSLPMSHSTGLPQTPTPAHP
jgi:hypothetical protein